MGIDDAILPAIVGGIIMALLKGIDYYIDSQKRRHDKETRLDDQKEKFLESLMERLEDVNRELEKAELYKDKYFDSVENKLKNLSDELEREKNRKRSDED